SAVMNLSRLGLSFSRRTRLIGFESISSLSKAIERIFERQARSRLTLAGVLGLGREGRVKNVGEYCRRIRSGGLIENFNQGIAGRKRTTLVATFEGLLEFL